MKVVKSVFPLDAINGCVATIGFFDGVHLGHQFLLNEVKRLAQKEEKASLVVTFDAHPKKILSNKDLPKLINSLEEKIDLLESMGIDFCHILDFNSTTAQMSSKEFMEKVLKQQLRVDSLIIGHDHHFGSDRSSTFSDYLNYGKELHMAVIQADKYSLDLTKEISSSQIRKQILLGKIENAEKLLGHPFSIKGTICHGKQLGTKIGFPTANIPIISSDKIIPSNGVYIVKTQIKGKTYRGIANLGIRPTIEDNGKPLLEVHLFDFNDDLYEKTISIEFVHRIRSEKHFNSIEQLIEQIKQDQKTAQEYFKNKPTL